MIASIAGDGQRDAAWRPSATRWSSWRKTRPEIVGMTADLAKYTDLHVFAQAYPDRFYQMGMAEQLLMGAAAGLAREGFMPFVTTYAVFASRRAYDFICLAIAEEGLNVKIACALPGLTTGYGPSHQATEDLAIFRGHAEPDRHRPLRRAWRSSRPCRPSPRTRARSTCGCCAARCRWCWTSYGYRFELGKAKRMRDGADVLVVSSGFMTMRALEAAELLAADRVGVAVLHVPTIKPLDTDDDPARGRPGRPARGRGGEPLRHRRPGRGGRGRC